MRLERLLCVLMASSRVRLARIADVSLARTFACRVGSTQDAGACHDQPQGGGGHHAAARLDGGQPVGCVPLFKLSPAPPHPRQAGAGGVARKHVRGADRPLPVSCLPAERVHQKTGVKPAKLLLKKDGVSFQLDEADTVQVALQDGDVVHTAPSAGASAAPPAQKKAPVVVPQPPKAAKAAAVDDDSDDSSDSDEPVQPPAGGATAGKKGCVSLCLPRLSSADT
jgi:hypothetical protein